MAGYSFLQGAFILLIAGLINRFLGFGYQIAIIRLIGPEGVGLFNIVFPVYIMMLVLASAGIPLAIAKLVAEEVANNNIPGAYRIFKLSLFILLITSLFFTVVLIIAAPILTESYFPNPRVYYCLISLVPGIIIVTLCSAFRGFFQGLQQMSPTAITQTIEQLVRVVSGLVFAYIMLPLGIEYAAVGLSVGVILGELTGFVLMLRIYANYRPIALHYVPGSWRKIYHLGNSMKKIFTLAIPVTLTRIVATALMSIQAVLIPQRLQVAGLSIEQATSAYGQFIGIAEALLFMPGVLTMALATSLVPAMSDAIAANNLALARSRILDAVRLTLQVGVPAAFIFLLLADELCGVLFGYVQAGAILKVLALSGPFLYLQQTTTGILQGVGKADVPFKNLVASSLVCIMGIYYLTAVPQLGMGGTAAAVAIGFIIMPILNMLHLFKMGLFTLSARENVLKPLVAALGMSLLIIYTKKIMYGYGIHDGLVLVITLLAGGFTYLVLMQITGGINDQDRQKFGMLFKFNRR
ncbi:stage V sporulation protein B [Desulfoscipio gibsoniae]|uniref:Stage V sporulation protein B n=1 Tax=Desulfoscipio gibsoniae DSM 7213 TaxID=767817 RepID=R4KE47_9FIRM|nr:stage V sporulation protein B [Desulfoscipio gibsoniae]AGL01443.1 stage V sporulation protein B [Desulfoscipio gibsoniae DSM 7213]